MTSATSESSDSALINAVRGGDLEAYGELFSRHRGAAHRLARQLVRGSDADDLVAESFVRVMGVLRAGKGPDEFFRAYLLSSIRRLHIDRIRATRRIHTTGDEAELDRAVAFVDPAEMEFEQQAAATAFASLPERWQLVLWHLDVEGQKPAQIAPLLGMSPNSVSALAYRAREGLRLAYLQGHLAPPLDDTCRWTTARLAQHVRGGLSKRDAASVDEHLESCSRCSALHLELTEVNSHLASLLAPAVLGAAASGYLAAGASSGGVLASLTRPSRRDPSRKPAAVLLGIAAVAGLLVVGAVAVSQLLGGGDGSAAGPHSGTTRSGGTAAPDSPTAPSASGSAPAPSSSVTVVPSPIVPTSPYTRPRTGAGAGGAGLPSTTRPGGGATSPPPTGDPGTTSTDYAVAVGPFEDLGDEPLRRRTTIAPTDAGEQPDGAVVTLRVKLDAPAGRVVYRGGSWKGWDCGDHTSGDALTSMTCTRRQTGASMPRVRLTLVGVRPRVAAWVSAAGNSDPRASNNSAARRAGDWKAP